MKRLKRILAIVICLITLIISSSCIYKHRGDDKHFYTQAVMTIPLKNGCISNGEMLYSPYISVLEEDEYGRSLFLYSEMRLGYYSKNNFYTVYLLVNQKFEDETTYYYPDYSYFAFSVCLLDEEIRSTISNKQDLYALIFDKINTNNPSDLENLKSLNDWGKPINEQKLESSKFVENKPREKIKIKDYVLEELGVKELVKMGYSIHNKDKNLVVSPWVDFVARDKYGRELLASLAEFSKYYDNMQINYSFTIFYIFTPDKKYVEEVCTMAVANTKNIQTELKDFKERNNWNKPL